MPTVASGSAWGESADGVPDAWKGGNESDGLMALN
jgi:hypothetical protein